MVKKSVGFSQGRLNLFDRYVPGVMPIVMRSVLSLGQS